jgi:uncharacterized protein (TIGR02217 family)
MSTQVFPSLSGQEFNIKRTPIWAGTTIQESVSGKRTGIQNWSYPRYQWEVSFSFLPDTANLTNATATADYQTLLGFFNSRGGRFDTFLYDEPNDDSVTGGVLGTGDGVTATFQLIRSYGGFVEPIYAPHTVSKVYVNGVDAVGHWSVSNWGTTTPGVITFSAGNEPGLGTSVTADFTFYWPVRFDDDTMTFNKFMTYLYEQKGVKFSSEK